jgi:hypothetical protein
MLGKIADFYEQEVDSAIANLLTLIEPLLIGFLGVTIGSIVIAMYLPLFTLIGKLSARTLRSGFSISVWIVPWRVPCSPGLFVLQCPVKLRKTKCPSADYADSLCTG